MIISFIICTYNRDKYIYECLSRLAKNTCQEGWEIVLVNNNSTDNTAAECERFVRDYKPKNYRYFVETQQGLSFARNRGIAEAKGDWLVFLDDDAMVEDSYIANLHQQLAAHPEVGAFGGKIIPFFEDGEPSWLSPWSVSFVSGLDYGSKVCQFQGSKYPIGANMGISRTVIEQVGVFNTELGRTGSSLLGGEEKDIFNRIKAAGYSILYFPDIPVQHCIPGRRTTTEFIARLGFGVGMSERMRTLNVSKSSFCRRVLSELSIKWGGTIALWFLFCLKGKKQKGDILILFRKNVTRGLLSRNDKLVK